jgi:hypothetical protein
MIPGKRGFYEGTDKEGRYWRIPRHVDPAVDGLALLSPGRQPRFDVADPPDSVPLREFDKRLEATVPGEVLARIDNVIASGKLLAQRGLADTPPLDEYEWRRGIILSWCHARDLELVHEALGHPRFLANRHDVDELVLGARLKKTAGQADQWYKDYVASLDEGAWVNVGFFNPNISASLYKWGDARHGTQNAMDAHRLSAHHQGTPEALLDWVERAVNFVVHHIPREHWGIRHEPRGSYADLEDRLADDPAIKDASIGKAIARDATRLFELLEAGGFIVPWGLLKVPDDELTPSVIEHAFCVAQAAKGAPLDPEDEIAPRRVSRAHTILSRLPEAIEKADGAGEERLAIAYRQFLADV